MTRTDWDHPSARAMIRTILNCAAWGALLLSLAPVLAQAPAHDSGRSVLYAATGATLTQYDVDPASTSIEMRSSVQLPANVQYAWQHTSRKYLYVVWSDGGSSYTAPGAAGVPRGKLNGLSAFRIDTQSGVLQSIGPSVSLTSRPLHVSTDATGTHVLVAYNDPSGLTVHRLNADGTLGAQVKQPPTLDSGIYAHQVRVDPSNKTVMLVTRGNGPTRDKPEDRGAVKVFSYTDGVLKNLASIAPNGGVNFQPRHLDFHPSEPWVYLSLERQLKLQVYRMHDGSLDATPLFTKDSLAEPSRKTLRQNAGTVHVHPNGRFVYQANRSTTTDANGKAISGGGENSIAVYSINPKTGEPTLIQNADTHGAEPRTFSLDPSARILVAGNQTPLAGVPANLALFGVRKNGKLDFIRKYDVDAGTVSMFWMGIVPLP